MDKRQIAEKIAMALQREGWFSGDLFDGERGVKVLAEISGIIETELPTWTPTADAHLLAQNVAKALEDDGRLFNSDDAYPIAGSDIAEIVEIIATHVLPTWAPVATLPPREDNYLIQRIDGRRDILFWHGDGEQDYDWRTVAFWQFLPAPCLDAIPAEASE